MATTVLILRDVLGWPAKQTAQLLENTVASVNSALQRARETLREQLPRHRLDWAPSSQVTKADQAVLRRYMDAVERADLDAVAELLAEDVRTTMPPYPLWFSGRECVIAALRASWDPDAPGYVGRFHMVPTRANGQLAVAAYVRANEHSTYQPFAITVVTIHDGQILEMTAFHDPTLFAAFGLPEECR